METYYLHRLNQVVSSGEELLSGLQLEFMFRRKEGLGAHEAPSPSVQDIFKLKILYLPMRSTEQTISQAPE